MNAKKMKRRIVTSIIGLLVLCAGLEAQNAQQRESGRSIHRDGWDRVVPDAAGTQKPAPAPVRDLAGIWEATHGYRDGVQAPGARNYPSDGKPEHELPFTPLGLETWKSHKPGFGVTAVPSRGNKDHTKIAAPKGFPP